DIVKVKVIGVDSSMKRISLSMKAVMPKPQRHRKPRRKPKAATPAAPLEVVVEKTEVSAKPIPLPQPRRPKVEKLARKEGQPELAHPRPRKPIETVPPPPPPVPKQTMEEKIRMLQEKFGRAR